MVSLGLWPASTEVPEIGFTFELLESLQSFTLGAACSLRDFCNVLQRHNPGEERDVYNQLRRAWYYVRLLSDSTSKCFCLIL